MKTVEPVIAADLSHFEPILQRLYAKRGIHSKNEIDYSLSAILPFDTLSQINKACERLVTAIKNQQHILIVGDFDTDGATSMALGVSALQQMGAKEVSFMVPNRFTYGYGLTPEIVAESLKKQPDIIITVDNGISSIEGVELANSANVDVIITDHHLPGDILPNAYAIVNPNQPNDLFASKHIAGVGVIFYLMIALRSSLEAIDWFLQQNLPKPNLAQFLDLVALGTVADVVQLDQNNRIFVHQGLLRIRAGQTRAGIRALLQVSGRQLHHLQADDLGFAIAPRLNAAGRLDDMSLGVQCLLTSDSVDALKIAQELDQLNQERRALEAQMQHEAFTIIEHLDFQQQLTAGICLFDETWHQGIVGLVAARVKDKLYRPIIAFARADEHYLKGSSRSIPGVHIRDILAIVNTRYPHLIHKFGGHAMAAGLTVLEKNYVEFTQAFTETIVEHVNPALFQPQDSHDGELLPHEFTLEIAELIRNSGPWGQGFPQPKFLGCFQLLEQRLVGQRHLKMKLQTKDRIIIEAIAFQVDLKAWPNAKCKEITCEFRLDVNEYQNQKKLQLIVEKLNENKDLYDC